jgi:hypothetical protein
MEFQPFNSVGGYSVNIPFINVIDSQGNITAPNGNIGNLIANTLTTTGNIAAPLFLGNIIGNVTAQTLTGTLTGNVIGNVVGNVIGDITGNVIGNSTGNIDSTYANIGFLTVGPITSTANITTTGNITATGNVTAAYFIGNVFGNTIGNFVVPGSNTTVIYNDNGSAGASENFKFDYGSNDLFVQGNIHAINFTGFFDGNAAAAYEVLTNNQPIINTIGTLTSLSVAGKTNLGSISNVTITGGTANYVISTDGTGNLSWKTQSVESPQGPNLAVQYNDNGSFNGSNNLIFTNSQNTLQLAGKFITNSLQVGIDVNRFYTSFVYSATTASTFPNQVLWGVAGNSISAVDFVIIATDSVGQARQTDKISAAILGTIVSHNEYGDLYINGGVGKFSVRYNNVSNNLELVVTPNTSNLVQYNMMITEYAPIA